VPAVIFAWAAIACASMIVWNASNPRAPTTTRPFTKKVGVPVTASSRASARSASTFAAHA